MYHVCTELILTHQEEAIFLFNEYVTRQVLSLLLFIWYIVYEEVDVDIDI
jgi:hypothetical protein